MTLGGNIVIRNGNEFDFCWREAIQSLLPVCDVVVVCDGQSTDNTRAELDAWVIREPKLKICEYTWRQPVADIHWFVDWINYAREHVPCDYQFQLDADEILHESSYPLIREFLSIHRRAAVTIRRLNFWEDAKHLIPIGHCCSHSVVRIAPQNVWLPSDGRNGHPKEMEITALPHIENHAIQIFHYGFLRRHDAFFAKERIIQNAFFGTYDPRLMELESRKAADWMRYFRYTEPLIPFNAQHPVVALNWLSERGYSV